MVWKNYDEFVTACSPTNELLLLLYDIDCWRNADYAL
jgi:hypothetical protein